MLRIFTEGDDEIFIQIFLHHLGYKINSDFETDSSGGWGKIKLIKPKIKEYIDQGDTVVLIFDADDNLNEGGYEVRRNAIQNILEEESLDIDFFLYPNNSGDGDFEKLVLEIAHEERKGVFTCFNGYETCVLGLNNENQVFKTPLKKSRFYAYFECIDESKKSKETERKNKSYFFNNSDYWDLDSASLNPLKDFLITNI